MKSARIYYLCTLLICFVGLQAQSSVSFPLDTTYTTYSTWQKIKKKYPDVRIPDVLKTTELMEHKNLVYATLTDSTHSTRALHLDIFRPSKAGKYPALIMIHGGGWRSGNKSMEALMAQRIALKGYVAIPVEYRLSLEARFPAAIYDIKAAVRWVKANADKYSIDTARIAIEGSSAGGQLATLVGMTNNVPAFEGAEGLTSNACSIQAVIDIDGVVDFLAPASLKIPRKPDSPDAYWLGGMFEEKPLRWKEASPIFWVNEHAVPMLFITSSQPRYHAGRDEMIDLLNQYTVYTESHNIPDSPHSFWLFDPWFNPTINYTLKFLEKVF